MYTYIIFLDYILKQKEDYSWPNALPCVIAAFPPAADSFSQDHHNHLQKIPYLSIRRLSTWIYVVGQFFGT